jgi:hypothetical protein
MIYQAQDIYSAAQQHYQTSYDAFEKGGDLYFQAQAIYRLGNIAELSGRPDQAGVYYRQAEALCRTQNLTPMRGLQAALGRVINKNQFN